MSTTLTSHPLWAQLSQQISKGWKGELRAYFSSSSCSSQFTSERKGRESSTLIIVVIVVIVVVVVFVHTLFFFLLIHLFSHSLLLFNLLNIGIAHV